MPWFETEKVHDAKQHTATMRRGPPPVLLSHLFNNLRVVLVGEAEECLLADSAVRRPDGSSGKDLLTSIEGALATSLAESVHVLRQIEPPDC